MRFIKAIICILALVVLIFGCKKDNKKSDVTYDHEFVDLGLPSGTLWAKCNVGASNPEDIGDYFAWGETATKDMYDWKQYKYSIFVDGEYKLNKYCTDSTSGVNGFADYITELEPADDAVIANWGEGWRMPTNAEMRVLVDSCDWAWTTVDGVGGYQVTSRKENDRGTHNSIFLPAAGYQNSTFYSELGTSCYYWTASQLYDHQAYCLYGTATTPRTADGGFDRYYGLCVRPVTKSGVIEGGGGDITGGHNPGGSSQTGGTGGNGGGNAGKGNTGGTIGN